jgi:hypothetical protein
MKRGLLVLIALVSFCRLLSIEAFGQTEIASPTETPTATSPARTRIPPASHAEQLGNEPFHSDREIWLSSAVLIFGILFLILTTISLFKLAERPNSGDLLKAYTISVIIIGVLFMIAAGWSNDQIAPATGLFGSIVGYLLGRSQTDGSAPPKVNTPPETPLNR